MNSKRTTKDFQNETHRLRQAGRKKCPGRVSALARQAYRQGRKTDTSLVFCHTFGAIRYGKVLMDAEADMPGGGVGERDQALLPGHMRETGPSPGETGRI